jgi:hypothetical protein
MMAILQENRLIFLDLYIICIILPAILKYKLMTITLCKERTITNCPAQNSAIEGKKVGNRLIYYKYNNVQPAI